MTAGSEAGLTTGRSVNQLAAGLFGAVFVLVGLAGFFVSGDHDAVGKEGGDLLGLFQVNLLHNIVHLAVGAALIAGAILGHQAARTVNMAVGAVYLVVGLVGLFITDAGANIIAANHWDNALHLVVGALLLGVGWAADKARA